MFILDGMNGINFLKNGIFWFFGSIDKIIYGVVGSVMQEFFTMTSIRFVTTDMMSGLMNRMYVVISVFMVFKLMFSFAKAMVSPDSMSDKKAGIGSIATRTVTAVALLIFIPTIFDTFIYGETNGKMNQQIIASIIPRLVLGSSSGELDGESLGTSIAKQTFSAFMIKNETCSDEAEDFSSMTIDEIADIGRKECSDKSTYAYNYQIAISTVAGIILLVVLVGYTLDLVARGLKLIVLQMIAPIPIIMYIDPNQSKDGTFNNWVKATISTYADLFIKLITMYFAIYFVSQVVNNMNNLLPPDIGLGSMAYLTVFLILGAFIFLLQLPKFVKGIFGIKDQGLGAGLGAVLGTAGALVGGAEIGAALKAGGEGAQAGAEGKASLGQFNKGNELGHKLSGKPTRAEKKQVKTNQKLADKKGFTQGAVDHAKENADFLDQQASEAEARASLFTATESDKMKAVDLRRQATQAQANADKIKGYRDDPKKAILAGKGAHGRGYTAVKNTARGFVGGVAGVAGGAVASANNFIETTPFSPLSTLANNGFDAVKKGASDFSNSISEVKSDFNEKRNSLDAERIQDNKDLNKIVYGQDETVNTVKNNINSQSPPNDNN